jgi:hypothetical protein
MQPHLDLPAIPDVPEPAPSEVLLATIAALAAIMAEENESLASGYPAGLEASTQRKADLAAEYAEQWQELEAELAGILADDPGFGRRLMAAVGQLRLVAGENVARLEAAMSASRRRVESILAALRDEARGGATYGGRGDIPLDLRLPPFGTDFHA